MQIQSKKGTLREKYDIEHVIMSGYSLGEKKVNRVKESDVIFKLQRSLVFKGESEFEQTVNWGDLFQD